MSGMGRPLISLFTVQTILFWTSLWRHFLRTPSALGGATIARASKSSPKSPFLQVFGRVLDPTVFFLLLEVRLLVGRMAKAEALLHRPRRIGAEVALLPVLPCIVTFRAKVDLVLVAVIAKEEDLAFRRRPGPAHCGEGA